MAVAAAAGRPPCTQRVVWPALRWPMLGQAWLVLEWVQGHIGAHLGWHRHD